MSDSPSTPSPSSSAPSSPPASPPTAASALTRRRIFAGVGTVGALAATAAVLPLGRPVESAVAASSQPPAEPQGGYQVTPHVLRYYQTAKV